ncbi:hypothetical protein K7432_001183 [Basidiobolus ranarum]
MRLATQHTREVDKEFERKKKKQQLENEKKRKEQEKRRQEGKATTAVQLAEMRKRDLALERERAERRREREREIEREKLKADQSKTREPKSSSYRREKDKEPVYSREPPKRKPFTSMSFDDLINQASDIPTSSLKLVPTSRVSQNANTPRSSTSMNAKRDFRDSGRNPKGTSGRDSSTRDRTSIDERNFNRTKSGSRSREEDNYRDKRDRISESDRDRTRSVSSSRSALPKSTSMRDVRRSVSDLDVPSRKAKLSPGTKSASRSSEVAKGRRRSLTPPPKSRKRSLSPSRKASGRKPIDDREFNEDYVKRGNISSIIGQLFGYDRSRYANERYSDDDMEASITDLRKEESRSAKIARLEDEREEELERQEQERLKARKKARLDMERKKGSR